MVTIFLAYTAPVNPAGTTQVLTHAQVWAGFQRKIRRPYEFVPAIESAEVISEKENSLTREVVFKAGAGPAGKVKEVCISHAPCRVDYLLDNGSKVMNIIGAGPSGDPSDLFVTYAFEWKHDDIAEGSAEAKEKEAMHQKVRSGHTRLLRKWMSDNSQTAKLAVDTSIATTRKLVSAGEIQ